MGVARRLRPRGVFIAALEPSAAPLLQGGRVIGPHKIEGIGDDFIPPIVDRRLLDGAMSIQDGDAVLMAARLARELGLGVGISSGANLLGSILLDSQGLGPVATVFADDNKKYLSTSLADPAPAREDFLSPRVELITWRRVGSAFPPAG